MTPVLIAIGVLSIGAGLLLIALFSTRLGRPTCCECGSQLPVRRLASEDSITDDWACTKCGTRFDRRGRARNQLPT
jgi:hypothetical protein